MFYIVLNIGRPSAVTAHLWGIINAFVLIAYNAMAESMSSKIKAVKITARGFRNEAKYKAALYFHLGGLELHSWPTATDEGPLSWRF